MNIVIFSTDDFLHPAGGAERSIADITRRLPDISFDLICARLRRSASRKEVVGNVTIHRVGFGIPLLDKLLVPLVGYFKAQRLRKKKHVDVFWTVMVSFAPLAAYIHNILHPGKRVPIVQTVQEGDSREHIRRARGGLVHRMWKFAFSHADQVTVISHYLEGLVRSYGFIGKIDFVPNGVDIETFKIRDPEKERDIKESYNLDSFDTVLVTTSRLEEKNGVEDIIKALEYLPESTALLVVGDGSLRKHLEKLASKKGFFQKVFFVGYREYEEIPSFLHVSDVFVRPSLSEGMGNSFLEAMAAGVPVVGTPVGGIVDFLKDEKTGFLCDPKNPESCADAVEKVLALSEEEKSHLIARARKQVEGTYEWQTVARQMKKVFENLPQKTPALVFGAHLKSSLSIIRSLGERGIPVYAASKRKTACGLHSRFIKKAFVYTSPADLDAFCADVERILDSIEEKPVVYTLSDAATLALARNESLQKRLRMLVPDTENTERGFSKRKTLARAQELGLPVPHMISYTTPAELRSSVSDEMYPLVVKPEHSFVWVGGRGERGDVAVVHSTSELIEVVEGVHARTGEWPLVQEYIEGEEGGVEFLYVDGRPRAVCAHHRIRSLSPQGGASVVKESIEPPDDIGDMSKELLTSLSWHGPAMVEWKRDSDGNPYLMEINGRFWGSLPLAVASGADIPHMYYQVATGGSVSDVVCTPGVRTQHILGDIAHLLGVATKKGYIQGRPYPRFLKTLKSFLVDLLFTKHDVWSLTDPLPGVWEIIDYAGKMIRKS